MATNIVGKFPILNSKQSQTDEYGFDYITYQYTIETTPITTTYTIPKKDDIFSGVLQSEYTSIPLGGTSLYVVTNVETNLIDGGLTVVTISTVGCKNSIESSAPKISILSNGPLIFGLSGTPPSGQPCGYGIAGKGQTVEMKFIANGGVSNEQQLFNLFFGSVMPTSFRGASLPAPAKQPGVLIELYPYYGFIGKTVLTEKRGGLLLVTVTFSEAGKGVVYFASIINAPSNLITAFYYDFTDGLHPLP